MPQEPCSSQWRGVGAHGHGGDVGMGALLWMGCTWEPGLGRAQEMFCGSGASLLRHSTRAPGSEIPPETRLREGRPQSVVVL